MKPISLSLQTLYADLVQQVHNAPALAGSVYTQTIKGHDYLYVRRSVGAVRKDLFLGRADDPAVQAKAANAKSGMLGLTERRNIVHSLRSLGLPTPSVELGRMLDALADAGLFKEAVLVGTAAYQCYSPIVGMMLPSAALMTQGADLATASLALAADGGDETLETILKRADRSFTAVLGLDPRRPPSRFRSEKGFLVDLLTPQRRRSDTNPMPLKQLGAGAVPLQHLGWLIETPIQAVALHAAGVPVRVPVPARYAAHKLIVAQKRPDIVKRRKDLMQAEVLIEALRVTDPWGLTDAIEDARSQGRDGWRRPIDRSLKELNVDLESDRKAG
jgi:hypothetical protein